MRRQDRNILLLIDNAPTHALYETTHLTNITIKYLPPNTTAHLQPCDQGIINSFKVRNVVDLNITILYTLTYFSHSIGSCIYRIESKPLIILMNMVSTLLKLILKGILNMFHMHGIMLQILQLKIVGRRQIFYLIMRKMKME